MKRHQFEHILMKSNSTVAVFNRSVLVLMCLIAASFADDNFRLTIVHVNDIHAHLDPSMVKLDGEPSVQLQAGGASRLATAFQRLRGLPGNKLFLHAGDEFTGTPWFSVYKGLADAAVLDRLGFDAFVPGNHEFDQGPVVLGHFLDSLHTPAVAANLSVSQEPALRDKIRPAVVLDRGGRKIAIVGVAQSETPGISSPGPNLKFLSGFAVQSTVDSVRLLGASIVILLSHEGIEIDTVLARKLKGVSVVVGGHSHTRMGKVFDEVGLFTPLPYPVVVKANGGRSVPVVQSWEWGKEMGVLEVAFDREGQAVSWEGHPFLPASDTLRSNGKLLPDTTALRLKHLWSSTGAVQFLPPDSAMAALLAQLASPLEQLRKLPVATLPEALARGKDGALLQFCAQSLKQAGSKWGAKVGLMNAGGVRDDLQAGIVTREAVLRVAPFGNTVIVLTLSGKDLVQAVRVLSSHDGHQVGLAGAKILRDVEGRIEGMSLEGSTNPIADSDTVRIATNSYLAGGGDGGTALKNSTAFRLDTGLRDADALANWLGSVYSVK